MHTSVTKEIHKSENNKFYYMVICSAAYYVIFLSFDNPLTPEGIDDSILNPMPTPTESIMAMFLMSVNTFTDYYTAFDKTSHTLVAKVRIYNDNNITFFQHYFCNNWRRFYSILRYAVVFLPYRVFSIIKVIKRNSPNNL